MEKILSKTIWYQNITERDNSRGDVYVGKQVSHSEARVLNCYWTDS